MIRPASCWSSSAVRPHSAAQTCPGKQRLAGKGDENAEEAAVQHGGKQREDGGPVGMVAAAGAQHSPPEQDRRDEEAEMLGPVDGIAAQGRGEQGRLVPCPDRHAMQERGDQGRR